MYTHNHRGYRPIAPNAIAASPGGSRVNVIPVSPRERDGPRLWLIRSSPSPSFTRSSNAPMQYVTVVNDCRASPANSTFASPHNRQQVGSLQFTPRRSGSSVEPRLEPSSAWQNREAQASDPTGTPRHLPSGTLPTGTGTPLRLRSYVLVPNQELPQGNTQSITCGASHAIHSNASTRRSFDSVQSQGIDTTPRGQISDRPSQAINYVYHQQRYVLPDSEPESKLPTSRLQVDGAHHLHQQQFHLQGPPNHPQHQLKQHQEVQHLQQHEHPTAAVLRSNNLPKVLQSHHEDKGLTIHMEQGTMPHATELPRDRHLPRGQQPQLSTANSDTGLQAQWVHGREEMNAQNNVNEKPDVRIFLPGQPTPEYCDYDIRPPPPNVHDMEHGLGARFELPSKGEVVQSRAIAHVQRSAPSIDLPGQPTVLSSTRTRNDFGSLSEFGKAAKMKEEVPPTEEESMRSSPILDTVGMEERVTKETQGKISPQSSLGEPAMSGRADRLKLCDQVELNAGLVLARTQPNTVSVSAIKPASFITKYTSIQVGDTLLAINGHNISDLALEEIKQLYSHSETLHKLDFERGDMPFVVDVAMPQQGSKKNATLKRFAENLKKSSNTPTDQLPSLDARSPGSPRNPEQSRNTPTDKSPSLDGRSLGTTLVLKEDMDVIAAFPEAVYPDMLIREIAGCIACEELERFDYVGHEEGSEPGTTLMHINLRPPHWRSSNQRSADDLAHSIGAQLSSPDSLICKGLISKTIQHLGLHQPLKKRKAAVTIVDRRNRPHETDNDLTQGLASVLSEVRGRIAQMSIDQDDTNKPQKDKGKNFSHVLSPEGTVYSGQGYIAHSHGSSGSSNRYESTEEFLSALRRKVKPPSWPEISNAPQDSNAVDTTFEASSSQKKPLVHMQPETENRKIQDAADVHLQPETKNRKIQDAANDIVRKIHDAVERASSSDHHVSKLQGMAEKAVEEATKIREENRRAKDSMVSPRRHEDLYSSRRRDLMRFGVEPHSRRQHEELYSPRRREQFLQFTSEQITNQDPVLIPQQRVFTPLQWGLSLGTSDHVGFFKVTGIKPIEGDFQRLGILQNGGYTRVEMGDIVLSIDYQSVKGQTLYETIKRMQQATFVGFMREFPQPVHYTVQTRRAE